RGDSCSSPLSPPGKPGSFDLPRRNLSCDAVVEIQGSEMEITTIGIDLAKSAFAVSGADSSGRVVVRRQLRRAQVLRFMRGVPQCTIGVEARGGDARYEP